MDHKTFGDIQLMNMQTEAEYVIKRLHDAVLDVGEKLNHLNSSHDKQRGIEVRNEDLDDISLPTESISTFPCLTSTPRSENSKHPETELKLNTINLMKELNNEKEINKQLQDKINKLEDEKVLREVEQSNIEPLDGNRIGEMLEEIYKAQKKREEVMMERIKAANHDRDEALLRAKALKEELFRNDELNISIPPDQMTVTNLLNVIESAKSPDTIKKYSSLLFQHVNELRSKRLNQTAEEIKVLMEEKNGAVKKCKKLEKEMKKINRSINKESIASGDDTSELQADLQKTTEERDQSLEKLHHLEEEVETLRVYYNINKSLAISQDQELMEKYNTYLMSVRKEAAKRIEESQRIASENQKLQEALRQVTVERNSFAIQNQKMTTELNEAYTKCKSLERLVKVLRKKLVTNTNGVLQEE